MKTAFWHAGRAALVNDAVSESGAHVPITLHALYFIKEETGEWKNPHVLKSGKTVEVWGHFSLKLAMQLH